MTKFDAADFKAKLDAVNFDEFWELLARLQANDDKLKMAEEKLRVLSADLAAAEAELAELKKLMVH
jgi:hypothetical protein